MREHHHTAAAATEKLKGYSSYGIPLVQEHGISTPMGFPAQNNKDRKKNPKASGSGSLGSTEQRQVWREARKLHRTRVSIMCFLGRLLPRSQPGKCWVVWLHCKEANPGSPVSSVCATPGKKKSACSCPTGCKHHPPMGNWIIPASHRHPCWVQFHGVGRKSSSSRNIQGVRPLEVLSRTRTKCLAPSCGLSQHYPQWETHDLSP